jgi:Type ISP C-terminal specificity domain/N-6 DNA Methylase
MSRLGVPDLLTATAFSAYLTSIEGDLKSGLATEHTHRPALKALVEAVEPGVNASNDPKRVECGAPDFTIWRPAAHGPLTLGYIEAKDVGKSLNEFEQTEQFERYRDGLHNLLVTDYLEFRWYAAGELRLTGRLATVGSGSVVVATAGGQTQIEDLLKAFIGYRPAPVTTARDLAQRMARVTHLIRDVIVRSFERGKPSQTLKGLHGAFSEVLIPDLATTDFADMFAQTLSYGLFAARVNHDPTKSRFDARDASLEIPKTNPFLRHLFDTITGPALQEEPFADFVDDLAEMLADAKIEKILKEFGQVRDPIVHFYETFLAAYDPKLREARGVYYTPEPVVRYIVRSVETLLKDRFGVSDGFADTSTTPFRSDPHAGDNTSTPRVFVLDPAVGTGTFLYAVVNEVRQRFMDRNDAGKWSGYVRDHLLPRLFGFELLMAPYAVAHLKLGMQLAAQDLPEEKRGDWAYDFGGHGRLGVYLTNSLEEALKKSELLLGAFISEEANAAAEIKRDLPILVVLGNPPYSGHSANKGKWITDLVYDYKRGIEGLDKPAQAKWLQDDYVKFLRFGQWRINQTGAGILAFITNHAYLDNPTFRGMRKSLIETFTDIYLLDLHGNSKKNEVAPDGSDDKNVFDIQQGVAIGLFVKEPGKKGPATIHRGDLWGTRDRKYKWLATATVAETEWEQLEPVEPFYLFIPQNESLRAEYLQATSLAKLMDVYGDPAPGIVTTQDQFAISWTEKEAVDKVERFLKTEKESEARAIWKLCSQEQWNYKNAKKELPDSGWEKKSQRVLYRPFDIRWTIWDSHVAVHRRTRAMRHLVGASSRGIVTVGQVAEGIFNHVVATDTVIDNRLTKSNKGVAFVFPLYLLPTEQEVKSGLYDRAERRANINEELAADVANDLGLVYAPLGAGDLQETVGPEDLFYYTYGILHSPTYRDRYSDFLRSEFPRIPFTTDVDLFRDVVEKGRDLFDLHIFASPLLATTTTSYPVPGSNAVEAGHPTYMPPGTKDPQTREPISDGRVYISKDRPRLKKRGQYFEGVAPEVWEFHLNGYQVLHKWLKDRRGRQLSLAEIEHYEKIVKAISETIRLMAEVDEAIPAWPVV